MNESDNIRELASKLKMLAISADGARMGLNDMLVASKSVSEGMKEAERLWRDQYAKAGSPNGDSEKGFEKFVRESPLPSTSIATNE